MCFEKNNFVATTMGASLKVCFLNTKNKNPRNIPKSPTNPIVITPTLTLTLT